MNNPDKQYTDLVNDAYKNYGQITNEFQLENPIDDLLIKTLRGELILFESDGDTDYRTLTKKEFINKIKTDDKFAKKWGFQVYTRELSLDERKEILYSRFRKGPMIVNGESYIEGAPTDINFEFFNIPRRTISLTYNNQTIEIYE